MIEKIYRKYRRVMFSISQMMSKEQAIRVYSEFVFDLLERKMIVFSKRYYESRYSYAQGIYVTQNGQVDFKNEIEVSNCNSFLRREFQKMKDDYELQESIQKVSTAIQQSMEKIQK